MAIDITDREQLERYLQDRHVSPERSLGQNFLVCPEVTEATLAALDGGPMKVTELGAGLGTLTQGLVASGYEVRAIERDERLAEMVEKLMPPKMRNRVKVLKEDLRKCDWTWDEPYQVVGNIPYNLSGLIVRHVTQLDPVPERVVLLVQKEVGERLVAQAPNLHLISLAVQLWGRADALMNVPADCFLPPPQVTSQLVILTPRESEVIDLETREKILMVAKVFFQGKRKQMGGRIKRQWRMSDEEAEKILAEIGVAREVRPQEVTVEQWMKLGMSLQQ